MAFVPEGQHDSSQARSAWVSREAPRPGGTVEVEPVPGRFFVETEPHAVSDLFNRPAGTGPFYLMTPGTSCLATIVLSLRDKIHSTAEVMR